MNKNKVFVIMPFEDRFFEVYEMIRIQMGDAYDFSHAGEAGNQQNILKDIVQPIYEADVVIADLTGLNPNVMYELGLAHAFNKKTIIITQDTLTALPFDLKQYRAKDYSVHFIKFAELIEYLKNNLKGAVDNTVVYSNPVKDFLDLEGIQNISWFSKNDAIIISDESEKGILDYIANIEESINEFNEHLNAMTSDMIDMNNGVSMCTSEIDRVNKNGGNGTVAFVRKTTKQAAKHIESFSLKLKVHNSEMVALWDEIESNTLGLLENPLSVKEKNIEGLISYLKSLFRMKDAAKSSAQSVESMRTTLESIMGIERSMNQAIRFADEDLCKYVMFTEKMSASIDRIQNKAKFIVGDIENNKNEE